MKKKFEYAELGSISSGTMRPKDLIPEFAWTLEQLAKVNKDKDDLQFIKELNKRMESEDYYETEDSEYDLNEDLFDRLNKYAPPYAYFGSHPGNGADYGFWISEFMEDDFDGLKVSDTSEVPKGYTGEVLHVNDHGNMTLYAADKGKLTEIWAVV